MYKQVGFISFAGFIPASNEPSGCLQTFGSLLAGIKPAALRRCKFDTPLLAAGSLISDIDGGGIRRYDGKNRWKVWRKKA